MADEDKNTDGRKRLQTESDKIRLNPSDIYVSADEIQIEMWDEWADDLDIPRSKFVRMATNAGIKAMDLPGHGERYDESSSSLKAHIFEAIESGASDAEEVVERVCEDIQSDIRDELDQLMGTGQIDYSARQGLHKVRDQ